MRTRSMRILGSACLLALSALLAPAARACVAIVQSPEGPLPVLGVDVKATVEDAVLRVKVEHTVRNDYAVDADAQYLLPVPEGAAVASFAMIVDGKRIKAEVRDKEAARAEFQKLVRQSRNPALLEFLAGEIFRADVGSIPAGATRVMEVVYEQTLSPQRGLFSIQLPLQAAQKTYGQVQRFALDVRLKTSFPLQNLYSPSHEVVVDRYGKKSARVSYEAENLTLDRDVQLYFSASPEDLGISLMTHRVTGADGYFLLMVTPPAARDDGGDVVARDVSFVVDVSGSMNGGKIRQAQRALNFCVERLNPEDRFELISFSSGVSNLTKGMLEVSKASRKQASGLISGLRARGGTNIHGALSRALSRKESKRPHVVVFLTDGKPTEGITDVPRILASVNEANTHGARVFVIGIGFNLDVKLLDGLSGKNRGSTLYVKPDQTIDEEMGKWFQRISRPLLTDLALELSGIETEFVYPSELPDLHAGDQLLMVGRYKDHGEALVRLKGHAKTGTREFLHDVEFPELDSARDFLPRLWARRRVGYLLDKIRLLGEDAELVDEVKRLAREHNLVTPYTSFLVRGPHNGASPPSEPAPKPRRPVRRKLRPAPPPPQKGWLSRAADSVSGLFSGGGQVNRLLSEVGTTLDAVDAEEDAFAPQAASAPAAPSYGISDANRSNLRRSVGGRASRERRQAAGLDLGASSGKKAVEAAEAVQEMKSANTVGGPSGNTRHVDGKTFRLEGGVWTDAALRGTETARKLEVEWGSDAYFALLAAKPELGKFLALGEEVAVLVGGTYLRVKRSGGVTTLTAEEIAAAFP